MLFRMFFLLNLHFDWRNMCIVYSMLTDDAGFGHTWTTFLTVERGSQVWWEKRQEQKVCLCSRKKCLTFCLQCIIDICLHSNEIFTVVCVVGGGWGGNRLMLPLSVDNFFKCTVYFMNLVMCWVVFVIYRPATPEETTFHLLHLSLFREYLDFEFSFLKVNYMYFFAWLLS